MIKISGSQCRKARGLLSWNHRDLSHKSKLSVSRISNFERGLIHLQQMENKALYDAFKEDGIVFHEFGEVSLDMEKVGKKDKKDIEVQGMGHNSRQDRIIINDEDYRRLMGLEELRTSNN